MMLKELRELSVEALQDEKAKRLADQFAMRMQRGMGESIKPHLFKKNRLDVARIETILNEKRRGDDDRK